MRFLSPRISLRQMQYALAVAREKNFRRAAELCFVSQPSLSMQIAEMEKALEVKLFERNRREVRVTREGRLLLERMRVMLVEYEDLLELARQHHDPLSGSLRLGMIPTMCPYLLPDLVPSLRQSFPELSLYWQEDKTEELVRLIHDGELDAGVLALESDIGGLEYESFGEDSFVLATPPGHPLSQETTPVSVEVLQGEEVHLLEDGHCFREQAFNLCQLADARPHSLRASSLSTLVQMVLAGSGCTILPELAVEVENRRDALHIRPFTSPSPKRTLILAWRSTSPYQESLRCLSKAAGKALEKKQ